MLKFDWLKAGLKIPTNARLTSQRLHYCTDDVTAIRYIVTFIVYVISSALFESNYENLQGLNFNKSVKTPVKYNIFD